MDEVITQPSNGTTTTQPSSGAATITQTVKKKKVLTPNARERRRLKQRRIRSLQRLKNQENAKAAQYKLLEELPAIRAREEREWQEKKEQMRKEKERQEAEGIKDIRGEKQVEEKKEVRECKTKNDKIIDPPAKTTKTSPQNNCQRQDQPKNSKPPLNQNRPKNSKPSVKPFNFHEHFQAKFGKSFFEADETTDILKSIISFRDPSTSPQAAKPIVNGNEKPIIPSKTSIQNQAKKPNTKGVAGKKQILPNKPSKPNQSKKPVANKSKKPNENKQPPVPLIKDGLSTKERQSQKRERKRLRRRVRRLEQRLKRAQERAIALSKLENNSEELELGEIPEGGMIKEENEEDSFSRASTISPPPILIKDEPMDSLDSYTRTPSPVCSNYPVAKIEENPVHIETASMGIKKELMDDALDTFDASPVSFNYPLKQEEESSVHDETTPSRIKEDPDDLFDFALSFPKSSFETPVIYKLIPITFDEQVRISQVLHHKDPRRKIFRNDTINSQDFSAMDFSEL